jgi:glutaconate CoA-transferase, subunit B
MTDYTVRELMAVLLARELRDGEIVVAGGVRSAMPMAAIFLAQQLRCPDIQVVMGMGVVNPRPDRIWPSAGDFRYAAGCEGFVSMDEIFELSEIGRFDVAFYGGLQIDRFGNANLTWVDAGKRRIRGPGVANSTLAVTVGRTVLYSEHHVPRVFAPRVSFNTIPGHMDGGRPDGTGAGPAACITPLAVLDFPAPGRAMAVRSVHPGVTHQTVRDATGFDLAWPSDAPATEAPSAEELQVLRAIDRDGLLRD